MLHSYICFAIWNVASLDFDLISCQEYYQNWVRSWNIVQKIQDSYQEKKESYQKMQR